MNSISFAELESAYQECLRHKRHTLNALRFEVNSLRNLAALYKEINSQTYAPGKSACFVVTKPRPREIFAADFRDRVVHHLFINRIKPHFLKVLSPHAYACLEGRGTHKAVAAIRAYISPPPRPKIFSPS